MNLVIKTRWRELAQMEPVLQGKRLTEISRMVLTRDLDADQRLHAADVLAAALLENLGHSV